MAKRIYPSLEAQEVADYSIHIKGVREHHAVITMEIHKKIDPVQQALVDIVCKQVLPQVVKTLEIAIYDPR